MARRKRPPRPLRALKTALLPVRWRAAAAAKPQAGVTVTLSSASQALSSVSGTGGDVFNAQKVEAMKLSIADGSFKVNPEAIADKMLSNAAEMLGNARG